MNLINISACWVETIRSVVSRGKRPVLGFGLIAFACAVPLAACGSSSNGGGASGSAGTSGSSGVGGGPGGSGGVGGTAGTPGSGGTAGSGGDTMDSVCTDWANTFCDTLQQCASRIYLQYPSPADCVARNASDCKSDFALNSSWTIASQSACNTAYKAAGCPALFSSPSECQRPAGNKAVGSPCFKSIECVAGASCVVQPGAASNCGVCKMDAKVGEACGNGVQCVDGLRCDGTCYEPSQLGDPCYSGALCATPLVCGASGDPCHNPKQLGESCGPSVDDCDQYNGLHCNSGSNTCEANLVASNAGDHCGFDSSSGQITVCAGDLFCSGSDFSIDICNPAYTEGHACQVQSDGTDSCAAGLYCSGGSCVKAEAVVCQ